MSYYSAAWLSDISKQSIYARLSIDYTRAWLKSAASQVCIVFQNPSMHWGATLWERFTTCLTKIAYKYHVLMVNCDFPNIPLNQWSTSKIWQYRAVVLLMEELQAGSVWTAADQCKGNYCCEECWLGKKKIYLSIYLCVSVWACMHVRVCMYSVYACMHTWWYSIDAGPVLLYTLTTLYCRGLL